LKKVEVANQVALLYDGKNIMLIDERGKQAGKIREEEWQKMRMYYRHEEKNDELVVASGKGMTACDRQ